jgi:hypothetical protein
MLTPSELRAIAQTRLEETRVLFAGAQFDGARYICGYSMELMLKARICDTLGWRGYPSTSKEFQALQSFKTHNLDMLLFLSGREGVIKASFWTDWADVNQWNPENRYNPIGTVSDAEARKFLKAAENLMPAL